MNNTHCDTLRAKWHDEQCYESLHELLRLVMGVASLVAARRFSCRESIDDTAQVVATAIWTMIEANEPIDWNKKVDAMADSLAKKAVYAFNKDVEMKEHVKEHSDMEQPSLHSKAVIRDMAESGLVPREWQIVHRHYWQKKTLTQIGSELDMSKMLVSQTHKIALENMRQVLHRMGVYKENCLAWYYAKVDLDYD